MLAISFNITMLQKCLVQMVSRVKIALVFCFYIDAILPRYYLLDTFRASSDAEQEVTSTSFLVVAGRRM